MGGWPHWEAGKSPTYFHPGSDKGLMTGAPLPSALPVAIGSTIFPFRIPSCNSSVPHRCSHPLQRLAGLLTPPQRGAGWTFYSWGDCQSPEISSGTLQRHNTWTTISVRGCWIRRRRRSNLSRPTLGAAWNDRYLGLEGYYRCFVSNFSSLASPL